MPDKRWEAAQQIFHAAVGEPPPERERILAEACGEDIAMRDELRSLLELDGNAAPILDGSLSQIAGIIEAGTRESIVQQTFGPYCPIRLLGEGGAGVVFLARRTDVGSVVALKVLRDAGIFPERNERFAAEQKFLAQLSHPLIASLYDSGFTNEGTPWFAMEYVDGLPLNQYCAAHECSLPERMRLFRQVCEAVRYSHSQAIVHRDIKPSNILVTPDGRVKLLDFGIAKQMEIADTGSDNTRTGFRMMTPAYAAPEQIRGERPGLHTDTYSLGVALYELLTGQLPFDLTQATPVDAFRLITEQEPAAPSALIRVNAPAPLAPVTRAEWADLDVMCLKALRKDPERRYASADALIRDIDAFLNNEPLMARPDSWQYRTGKFFRRHRNAISGTAAAVVILAAVTGAFFWRLNREQQAAVGEAARAERLLKFTLSLFDSGGSDAGPSKDLKVMEILDRGARQAQSLKGDPSGQAELYTTLGLAYQGLGDFGKAEESLKAASLLRTPSFAPMTVQAAESQIALGLVHADLDQFEKAEKEIRAGLETLEKLLPARDPAVLRGKVGLGHVIMERGSYPAAVQILEPVIRMQQTAGSLDTDRAKGLYELSSAYFYEGDYGRSGGYVRQALSLDRSMYGAVHPAVAEDELQLCSIAMEQAKYAEAEPHCRTGVSIDQSWYGPANPVTASAMKTLAQVLEWENKNGEAKLLLDRVLAIQEATHGPVHQTVASALNELGYIAETLRHYSEAERDFERERDIYRTLFGDRHMYYAAALSSLANVAYKRRDLPRTEDLMRQALSIYIAAQGANHIETGVAHIKLGHVLLREKKYAAAREESAAGSKILSARTAPGNDSLQEGLKDLAEEESAIKKGDKPSRAIGAMTVR